MSLAKEIADEVEALIERAIDARAVMTPVDPDGRDLLRIRALVAVRILYTVSRTPGHDAITAVIVAAVAR